MEIESLESLGNWACFLGGAAVRCGSNSAKTLMAPVIPLTAHIGAKILSNKKLPDFAETTCTLGKSAVSALYTYSGMLTGGFIKSSVASLQKTEALKRGKSVRRPDYKMSTLYAISAIATTFFTASMGKVDKLNFFHLWKKEPTSVKDLDAKVSSPTEVAESSKSTLSNAIQMLWEKGQSTSQQLIEITTNLLGRVNHLDERLNSVENNYEQQKQAIDRVTNMLEMLKEQLRKAKLLN